MIAPVHSDLYDVLASNCDDTEEYFSPSRAQPRLGPLLNQDALRLLSIHLEIATTRLLDSALGQSPGDDPAMMRLCAPLIVRSTRLQRRVREERIRDDDVLREGLVSIAQALHGSAQLGDAVDRVRLVISRLATPAKVEIRAFTRDALSLPSAADGPGIPSGLASIEVEIEMHFDTGSGDWSAFSIPQRQETGPMARAYLSAVHDIFCLAREGTNIEETLQTHARRLETAWQTLKTDLNLGGAHPAPEATALVPVTPRELEVLTLLQRGETNVAIARSLYVTTETVKSHVKSLLRKFGVPNRSALIALTGLASPSKE